MTQTMDRTQFVGASEIAAIVGMDERTSAYEVWARKMGQMPEKESTPQMRRGLKLEPIIKIDMAASLEISEADIDTQVFIRHPEHLFLAATLDAVAHSLKLIEEWKTAGYFSAKDWGRPGTSEVPANYALQNTFQTALARLVFGAEYSMRLRLVPTETLESVPYPLKYDPDLGDMLIEAGVRFWKDHVETGIPPALSGTSAEAELFKKKYARAKTGEVVTATAEQMKTLEYLLDTKRDAARLGKEIQRATLELQEAMGVAESMVFPDGREITWKNRKGSPAWKKIAEEMGAPAELIVKHTPETGPRVFSLPKSEEENEEDV